MVVNPYFNYNNTRSEQNLTEELIIEMIQIYGLDVYYVPRTIALLNRLLLEDISTKFEYAIPIEAYVKSSEGYDGEYEIISRFGIQQEKRITLMISQKRWDEEYNITKANISNNKSYEFDQVRPMEGDLIYVPMLKKIFQIEMVRHETVFYDLGSLYTYDLQCEVFDFSAEEFNTGNVEIDDITTHFDSNIAVNEEDTVVEEELTSKINEELDRLLTKMPNTKVNNPFNK